MLKLIAQPNSQGSPRCGANLRTSESVPNFALPRNVVSEGVFANLTYLLTAKAEKSKTDAEGTALAQPFRASFIDNLKEFFRPAPKSTGIASSSLRGMASPGIKLEPQPLYLSLLRNIREFVIPSKLPPLELTSKPIEVPEIWSKQRKLSGANLASVTLHVGFTVLAVAFTIRQVTNLDPVKPVTVLLAAPPPTAPSPPAPVAKPAVTHRIASAKRKSFFVQGKLAAPSAIPKLTSAERKSVDVTTPDLSVGGTPEAGDGGVLGGVLGGHSGGIPGGLLGGVPAPPAPSGVTAAKPKVVRVGGDVKRPKAIYAPEPEYPMLARHAKITGIVILEGIVDERGNVVGLHVLKGEPLLNNPALEAVARWKFEPTYLNGVPIAVQMEFAVRFH
jgi:protein TonB